MPSILAPTYVRPLTALTMRTWTGVNTISVVGTISTGTWHGGTIDAGYGGTGLTSYTAGDILYATGPTTLAKLGAPATGGKVLGFVSGAPAWVAAGGGGGSPLTTKGDIYVFGTADTRLPVGSNGYALVADSTAATGLNWSRMQPYDAGALTSITAGTWTGAASITTVGTITSGTWNGTTIAVANGGTGATSAGSARTNLGLAIGTDVQAYNASLAAIAGGTWTGATSITTLGTVATGTWSASTIAVNKGGTGLTSYSVGDVLYATGTTTLSTTTSSSTGRSILALGAPPVGYVLGNSGSGLGWVALTVYVATSRAPELAFTIDQASAPAAVVTSSGTIGGP
jgi:hypothetical protein